MTKYYMSLFKFRLSTGETCDIVRGHHALFMQEGAVETECGMLGAASCYLGGGRISAKSSADILHFAVATEPPESSAILSESFNFTEGDAVLRLDQVSFPPGARAYRHTHPGPGIRFLTEGALEIKSDHHVEMMATGSAWFEDANSPVQATAGPCPTAFVRAMVLPIEFYGEKTLNILDPDDAALPMLQKNQRFFDQRVWLQSD